MIRIAKIVALTVLAAWCVYTISMDAAASIQVVNAKGDTCTYNVRSDVFADHQMCDGEDGVYWEERL